MFIKLRNFLILLFSFVLLTSVANSAKFPDGYPECWQDSKKSCQIGS